MPRIDALLAEVDNEAAATRRLLERVPEGRADWKPHEKSMSLGRLAGHVAELQKWGELIFAEDELDLETLQQRGFKAATVSSGREAVELHDAGVAAVRAAAAGATDERLATTWTLRRGETVRMKAPRETAFRTFVLYHVAHHRAQLGVYLRLLDVPLPPVYGPTADVPVAF
jgi:uncharacterized damage-inducible protein DinB